MELAVDGVPKGKGHTTLFAIEAVRGLVGDWMYRCGMPLAEMDERAALRRDVGGVLMCEHCSLRDTRVEMRVNEAIAKQKAGRRNERAGEDGRGSPWARISFRKTRNRPWGEVCQPGRRNRWECGKPSLPASMREPEGEAADEPTEGGACGRTSWPRTTRACRCVR